MKHLFFQNILLVCFSMALFGQMDYEGDFEDKTLSPYFFVKSDDPEMDQMPLKSTNVSVKIAGVIADVLVKQTYKNEGKKTLEAIYVFPASTRAAVYSLKMKIGERTIEAKIKEKEKAREIYENAKNEGRTASLLEQQRPNVFQMNVANILPQDIIEIELKYTELLIPEEKIYEFVYPTVVGPRYSNAKEESSPKSERWIKSPYFFEKEKPNYTFDIDVFLSAGLPVYEVLCPSHKVNINFPSMEVAKIKLDESEKYEGNRDFILRYKLSGKKIEGGLLLYDGEGEKFFLLMVQPPEKIRNFQIPRREYIFIVDVSGSMYGYPLEISKKVIKGILNNLNQNDKFNILLFAGSSYVLSEKSINATEENIKNAISLIDRQTGGGGTELLPALKRALSLPRDENLSTTIVVLTDGYVTVEKEAFDIIRKNLNKANLFAFGIGTSVNRYIIEGMARAGMAESFIVTKPEGAEETVSKFQKVVSFPALTDIKVHFNGFDVYDLEPIAVPDLFLEKPVLLFGKYKGEPNGTIEITGINGDGKYKERINVYEEKPNKANLALKYLWARHRIATLSDYSGFENESKNKEEIIRLGLSYSLLTQYTSFVAEDSMVRDKEGRIETVNQPLPLPEGVSNYAVGGLNYQKVLAAPCVEVEKKDKFGLVINNKSSTYEEKAIFKVISLNVSDKTKEKIVSEIIKKFINSVNLCKNNGKKEKIILEIILGLNGKLESIKILKSRLNKDTERCIIDQLKKCDFSILKPLKSLEINLELEFYV